VSIRTVAVKGLALLSFVEMLLETCANENIKS
jgi:hypothetical protein